MKQFSIQQFNWFNALDHAFLTNIIAHCQQNQYLRLAMYTDLFTLRVQMFKRGDSSSRQKMGDSSFKKFYDKM